MTADNFCYWLQGAIELAGPASQNVGFTPDQRALIVRHLALVFAHDIDPKAGGAKMQEKLNSIHGLGMNPSGVTARC